MTSRIILTEANGYNSNENLDNTLDQELNADVKGFEIIDGLSSVASIVRVMRTLHEYALKRMQNLSTGDKDE